MAKKIKILVVEDEPISALLLKNILEHGGYQVFSAENGQQAWDLLTLAAENFALVIADRMMPGLDGIELTKRIRANSTLNQIPVIMLTGTAEKNEIISAHKVGVYDFLLKPVEAELLLKVTERALRDMQLN